MQYELFKAKVEQEVLQFQKKYLRLSVVEDERLQFDVNERWRQKVQPAKMTCLEPKNQPQNNCTYLTEQCNYYSLAMMLFSQISTEPSLDVDILDTMFFMQDHSICYFYKDVRRGLLKTKQRGIHACEAFLKRKNRKKQTNNRERTFGKSKSSIFINEEKSEKSLEARLDYIALLRYKDGSFIRLKQPDLRSIFTNPLYANERFHHNNCTQYIQAICSDYSEQTRIHYIWDKFKDEPLMEAAKEYLLNKKYSFGDRGQLRSTLEKLNPTIFLYYTVFQICTFIAIHYNKQVISSHFRFVCEDETWYLAGIQNLRVASFKEKEFVRLELWEPKKSHAKPKQSRKPTIFDAEPKQSSLLLKSVDNYFTQTNEKIKKGVVQFVRGQVDNVRKVQDRELSKAIFQILHPGQGKRFYEYLDSPEKLLQNVNKCCTKKYLNKTMTTQQSKHESIKQPKRSLLQQMKRKKQKEVYIYRGLCG